MRVLILGGTGFLGPAVVAAALARVDEVTVLNRGRRGAAPATVRSVVGDRTQPDGLANLVGEWDLVVDTWSGAPQVVASSTARLRDRAARYAYVSSRSVYSWPVAAGADESAPVVDADPDAGSTDYAADKRGGELAVLRAFGEDRALVARAGLILGPGEDVGRLPWWLNRFARGGRVLAPGPAELPLQYVDARDLAAFLISTPATGALNTVSPPGHATMGSLLSACHAMTSSAGSLTWVPPEFVVEQGIDGWTELPIWVPQDSQLIGLHSGDVSRAKAAGLVCRPVEETVLDTWDWLGRTGFAVPQDRPPPGLDPEKERAALAAWDAARGQ
jgi:nucleoside-diphosphate-sugar epimerase